MPTTRLDDLPTDTGADAVPVLARLQAIEGALADLEAELAPERVAGHQVAGVVRVLRRIERRAGGARLLLADTAARTGLWRREGFRSPEEWAARRNGTTVGEAKADLRASKTLAGLTAARDAVASGDVSAEAAKAVAEGATAEPGAEGDLVAKARSGDLGEVRDAARRARQRADERDGRAAQRMYQRRALRTWVEVDGEGRGSWNVPPAYQAAFLAALEPYREEAFRAARGAGRRESPEALMADALYMLTRDVLADHGQPGPSAEPAGTSVEPTRGEPDPAGRDDNPGPTRRAPSTRDDNDHRGATDPARPARSADPPPPLGERPPRGGARRAAAQVHVHVDYDALLRGYATDGEHCEVPGLGPIPVALARHLANDAILHLVLTGTDVTVISSHRRYVPASVERALRARDQECVVPGCHARHHLEMHHWPANFAAGCPTSLATLARICRFHHHLVTTCNWRLTGGPGQWTLLAPGARDPDEPP